jgi:glyoxylase-like metal-dependent hydrolase (beta-lactamase superfamily II)
MDIRVISIGALGVNPLWNEREPKRTGHATTTLIRTGKANILVDPGLPAPALKARLGERVNLEPKDVTHVFLTSFAPECRRAIGLFDKAEWLLSETERESVGVPLAHSLQRLAQTQEDLDSAGEQLQDDQKTMLEILRQDITILARCKAAPDSLANAVDLFPLPGVTAGLCGLLIGEASRTTLICGDAIPTQDHLEQGKVLPTCWNREKAQESFSEAVEIADLLILGRDNAVMNMTRRGV